MFADALRAFRQLQSVDSTNATAATYLARIGAIGHLVSRPPAQPNDTLEYWSRTHERHFDVRRGNDWAPFYINGINLPVDGGRLASL